MEVYFIVGNLKANPFKLNTFPPIPGFRMLSWDSWTYGTLWDLGEDAGYSLIGKDKVYGQLWIPEDYNQLTMLESFCGVDTGLTEPVDITVTFPVEDKLSTEELPAVTYALSKLSTEYNIVSDGKWRF